MSLAIERPTKDSLIEVLEGLLDGRYSRNEIREWLDSIDKEFPSELHSHPLDINDGFYIWLTINEIRDEKVQYWLGNKRDFNFRNTDVRFLIDHLKGIPCEEKDGPFEKVYWSQIEESSIGYDEVPCEVLCGSKTNPFLNLKFPFYRMVLDNFYDLKEFVNIKCNEKYISIGTSLLYLSPCFTVIAKSGSWKEVVELFEYVGLSSENISFVNDSLKTKKYTIRRMDDNGIKFDVATFDNPINAYLKLNEYEGGIHKQTYWIEET